MLMDVSERDVEEYLVQLKKWLIKENGEFNQEIRIVNY